MSNGKWRILACSCGRPSKFQEPATKIRCPHCRRVQAVQPLNNKVIGLPPQGRGLLHRLLYYVFGV